MPASTGHHDAHYSLCYSRVGEGPAVVFLHGLASNRHIWQPQVEQLRATHTVLCLDLPGHGESAPVASISLDRLAASIAALIRSLRLPSVILVGHSLGGTVATWVAHALAGDVRGLVVVDSSPASMRTDAEARAQFRLAMGQDHDGALRRILAPAVSSATQLERVIEDARPVTADSYVDYLAALAAHDISSRNSDLRTPVHAMMSPLLVPRLDRAGLDAFGYSGLTDLSWASFPASKHYLFWDEPERFARELGAVLARFEQIS